VSFFHRTANSFITQIGKILHNPEREVLGSTQTEGTNTATHNTTTHNTALQQTDGRKSEQTEPDGNDVQETNNEKHFLVT